MPVIFRTLGGTTLKHFQKSLSVNTVQKNPNWFFLGKHWYCVLKTKEKKDHPAFISIRYITVYIGLEQHMLPSWWCLFLPFHTSGWQCYTAYFSTRVQVLNCCFLKLSHFKHFMFSIKYEFIKFVNHCSVFIYILQYFLEFGLFFTLRYPQ